MKSAALQQGIFDRLTGVTGVTDKVVGIYTKVPQANDSGSDSGFPFITINGVTSQPMDTKTNDGQNTLTYIHIWSRSTSALTWRAIADSVYTALQKYDDLSVTGANIIDCRFDSSTEFADLDEKTTHTVLTFRVTYFDI